MEGLSEIETHFTVFGGTAGGDEGVGGGLEGRETRTDNKHRATEATEGAFDGRGPEHQSTNAVDAEAGDEGPAVAKAADDPAGVGQGTDEVGSVCRRFVNSCEGMRVNGRDEWRRTDPK